MASSAVALQNYFLLLFAVLIISGHTARAQEQEEHHVRTLKGNQEIYAGLGVFPLPVIAAGIGHVLSIIPRALLSVPETEMRAFGPVMVGFNHYAGEKVGLGVLMNYSTYAEYYTGNGEKALQIHFLSVMPRFDYYWARGRNIEIYSGLSLGACYLNRKNGFRNEEDLNKIIPAVHLNTFGLRAGKKAGFFIDFGYGYNGIVNTGVNMRL